MHPSEGSLQYDTLFAVQVGPTTAGFGQSPGKYSSLNFFFCNERLSQSPRNQASQQTHLQSACGNWSRSPLADPARSGPSSTTP